MYLVRLFLCSLVQAFEQPLYLVKLEVSLQALPYILSLDGYVKGYRGGQSSIIMLFGLKGNRSHVERITGSDSLEPHNVHT